MSPGVNSLMADNGFFIGFKPDGTADMVFEGIFHFSVDLIYWYILAGLAIFFVDKIRRKNSLTAAE